MRGLTTILAKWFRLLFSPPPDPKPLTTYQKMVAIRERCEDLRNKNYELGLYLAGLDMRKTLEVTDTQFDAIKDYWQRYSYSGESLFDEIAILQQQTPRDKDEDYV